MSESNGETSVQREERLGLLTTRFISLLQDAKDSLLDLKMGADILAVVLEGNSCNTREKNEILKLKEELQDSKNKELENDLNYALEEQEDDCQGVARKAQENDESMEEGDSDDNNKPKVTSAQPTRQLPPRKAAHRHPFIQLHHEKVNENLEDQDVDLEETEDYFNPEEPEDGNEAVGDKAEDNDEAMEEDDSDDTFATKITSAQVTRQLPPRKAAQSHPVKNKKNSINKKKASPKERPTIIGSGKEQKENTKTRSRGRISTLNQQTNETKSQNTENHPVNNPVHSRVSIQDKSFEHHDMIEDVLQVIDKLCSLPSRRDYFFQWDKYTGYVDLFEITDPNIDRVKFDGHNVTDNFARPRTISRPQFEAFLRREMYGLRKEAAKDAEVKYRCPYCFMRCSSKRGILRHNRSRKMYGEWRRPACLLRCLKEPNPNGIYESKWPCQKRTPIVEIDCKVILIWIYSQLNMQIPGYSFRKQKGSKFVHLDS
ncbi:uncharacterized protein LOC107359259 isoform X1 [Tetranychus urticae]|uniref:uncharacterized protein LOC107359259 isoform X1 n=1 Tax=Tetranychus urticae TaxID=32264 RepID=UPI00077BA94E|nr:uncharacterized protein LOC107359259 isoform X1 [Tetranychus urticae]